MSHGARFATAAGSRIFDGHDVLYEKTRGQTWLYARKTQPTGYVARDYGQDYQYGLIGSTGSPMDNARVVSDEPDLFPMPGRSNNSVLIYPPVASYDDMIFLRPGATGFYRAVSCYYDLADLPQGQIMWTLSDAALDYVVASTLAPPIIPDTMHGIQLRDDTGALIYDSRMPQISVFQAERIDQSDMKDILLNDDTLTIQLEKEAPGCLIAPFHFANERISRKGSDPHAGAAVIVTQSADDEITLSRKVVGDYSTAAGHLHRQFVGDSLFLFARDIPS